MRVLAPRATVANSGVAASASGFLEYSPQALEPKRHG